MCRGLKLGQILLSVRQYCNLIVCITLVKKLKVNHNLVTHLLLSYHSTITKVLATQTKVSARDPPVEKH